MDGCNFNVFCQKLMKIWNWEIEKLELLKMFVCFNESEISINKHNIEVWEIFNVKDLYDINYIKCWK